MGVKKGIKGKVAKRGHRSKRCSKKTREPSRREKIRLYRKERGKRKNTGGETNTNPAHSNGKKKKCVLGGVRTDRNGEDGQKGVVRRGEKGGLRAPTNGE